MKKIPFMLFVTACFIAVALAFAFSLPAKEGKKFTVYHYTSTSTAFADMKDPGNWEGTSSSGCNPDEGSIPCALTYNGGNLGSYLDGLGSSSAIVEAADTKRYP